MPVLPHAEHNANELEAQTDTVPLGTVWVGLIAVGMLVVQRRFSRSLRGEMMRCVCNFVHMLVVWG